MNAEQSAAPAKDPKALGDFVKQIPQRVDELNLPIMITAMSSMLIKDQKDLDPEAFYEAKSSLKRFKISLTKAIETLDKGLAEL